MSLSTTRLQSIVDKTNVRWGLLVSLLLAILCGSVGWRLWQAQVASQEMLESVATVPSISTVTALGRLSPAGELVNVAAPTSSQESRIGELLVSVGDRIQTGQVIAVLDNRDRLQAVLRSAEHQIEIARSRQAQVEAGAKSGEVQAQIAEIARLEAEQQGSLETQRATIARIEAEVNNARTDFQRYDSLFQQGALSESERDSRRLTLTTTEQRLAEAEATLSRLQTTSTRQISAARATLDRIESIRPVDTAAATAEVEGAITSAEEAKVALEQAYVKAPSSGRIVEIHTRPGEVVGSDGVVTMGQTQQMMVIAEVYQDDIASIQIGQPVKVTTPVLSEPLNGAVESIGFQVARQQVVSEDPAANIDARIVEVNIRLAQASSKRVEGLSNLQVTAEIQI